MALSRSLEESKASVAQPLLLAVEEIGARENERGI
jgi:hypothetical protein